MGKAYYPLASPRRQHGPFALPGVRRTVSAAARLQGVPLADPAEDHSAGTFDGPVIAVAPCCCVGGQGLRGCSEPIPDVPHKPMKESEEEEGRGEVQHPVVAQPPFWSLSHDCSLPLK